MIERSKKPAGRRVRTDESQEKKPFVRREKSEDRGDERKRTPKTQDERAGRESDRNTRPVRSSRPESGERKDKPFVRRESEDKSDERRKTPKEYGERSKGSYERKARPDRSSRPEPRFNKKEDEKLPPSGPIRLNKYISNAGICSRREADKLIEAGAIRVNGKVVTELGTKISPQDKVQYGDQSLSREKHRYVLLNKPKGFITTTDDPEDRKTVMSLVANACRERIYPVGRLDRNTTGLLLLTNDGEMAKKLSHPRYGIKKIYHVVLDKNLNKADFVKIQDGIELEDGIIKVDAIEYVGDGKDKKELGIELHSGKNRIVRRIFEQLEYKVVRLDRVGYAGLTKKNLSRGDWRFLEEKELNILKMTL